MYQVALETFHGPLDLLLYLVKKNEVDVRDIPVSRVAEQFLHYLETIQVIDIEWAGEFLVMAATLLEVKSELLLPRAEKSSHGEAEDPRKELVRQLIEYRKTKEATGHLEQLAEKQQFQIARTPPDDEEGATSPRLRPVELWDLVSAFGRLIRETQSLQPQHVVVDETPQSAYEEMIRQMVASGERIPFRDVFQPPYIRVRLIGLFLALLELIKMKEIHLLQEAPFSDIWIEKKEPLAAIPLNREEETDLPQPEELPEEPSEEPRILPFTRKKGRGGKSKED